MSGTDLHSLQRWMSSILRDPRGIDAAVADPAAQQILPARRLRDGEIVREHGGMSPAQRLEIYRDGYFVRLPEAIEEDFPGLERALGHDAYRALIRDYLVAHPSDHPSLIFAGRTLPAFLRTRDDLAGHEFLADLAHLEWLRIDAFHAPRGEPLDIASLQQWTPEQWATRCLALDPSLRLYTFEYPVHDWYAAALDGEPDPVPSIPDRARTHLAIHRPRFRARHFALSDDAYATLSAIALGAPLAAALEHAGDSAGEVGRWFERWSAAGLFVAG